MYSNLIAFSVGDGGVYCTTDDDGSTLSNNMLWMNEGESFLGGCIDIEGDNGNVVRDPLFCHPDAGDYSLASGSPALELGIGADTEPGCEMVPVQVSTWGNLKTRFRD